jgi:hypothetical protein
MNQLSPITVFTNTRLAAQFWCLAFFVTLAFAIASPYFVIRAYRQQLAAVIIDPAGNVIHARVLGFEEGGRLQAYHAKLHCLAAFSRNPKGSDYPELAETLYIEPARSQLRQYFTATEKEFSEKNIQQKVVVHSAQVLSTTTEQGFDLFKVKVEGQIEQTGKINDLDFINRARFETTLTLVRNSDMLTNGRFPLVVYQFDPPRFTPLQSNP